ncbi:ParA family protein [Hugenholtzia roseola]|uniref:ParA family protein n=1 Tax=Hugenholtzia roseola TaxID=1002 RepID=UPI0003FC053F|nr:AAA family ATPase [Hugenholtzia roseola]
MATKISFFNHKGGVGKTTSLFNLGAMLAKRGKNVLLIDADTQCNLTLQVLGMEGYENHYEHYPKNNIKSYLAPAFDSQPILISAGHCISSKIPNLHVMPGSLDLSGSDTQLSMSFNLSSFLTSMQNLPGSFDYLIQKTAERYNADFVLIDLNPSLSAINQDLLISSDYFIIPTSVDYFSVQSIRSLATKLPEWETWAKKARDVFKDSFYPLPLNTPKFLGFTCNNFVLQGGGKPQENHRQMMDRIGKTVDDFLIPNLREVGMLVDENLYHQYSRQERETQSKYCIVEFSNYNKLNVISREQNIPIFEVSNAELREDNQRTTRDWFKDLYDYFANEIIIRTNNGTSN